MKASLPFVSVIVPTYHDWKRLQKCLDALHKQTYPEHSIEVIVVNNDPDDRPPDCFVLTDNQRVVSESKVGSYAARNCGITKAKGTIIAFTDSDCAPTPHWLEKAIPLLLLGHSRVGGHIQLFSTSNSKLTISESYEMLFAFNQQSLVTRGTAMTANLFVRRDVFDRVGVFNDRLLSGGDSDWGMRASKMGYDIVYNPDAIVEHPTRARVNELFRKARRVTGSIRSVNNYGGKYTWLTRGFHPPIRKMASVMRATFMSLPRRIGVAALLYTLKLYQTLFRILIYTKISTPRRS